MATETSSPKAWRGYLLQLPLWSLLILLVVTALLVVLLRFFMPHLDRVRPVIEDQLHRYFPFQVTSEHLGASLYRLDPRLKIQGLTLAAGSQPFLELEAVELELNTWRSLFTGQVRLAEANLQGLSLWLEETDQGWQLRDWPRLASPSSPAQQAEGAGLEQWLAARIKKIESLLVQGELDFSGLQLHLQPKQAPAFTVTAEKATYRRWQAGRQLDIQLALSEGEARSRLLVTLYGDDVNLQDQQVEAWFDFSDLDLESLEAFWPQAWQEQLGLPSGRLALQAWLSSRSGQVQAHLALPASQLYLGTSELELEALAATLNWHPKDLKIDFSGQGLVWKGMQLDAIQGRWSQVATQNQLLIESMQLAQMQKLLLAEVSLPKWVEQLLRDLQPQGELQQLAWTWAKGKPWELLSQLNGVSVEAWQGAPAIHGLDAWLQVDQESGRVIFDDQPLEVFFPQLYLQPFTLAAARGEVSWLLQEESIWVDGDKLSVDLPWPDQQGSSRVTGEFSLQLQPQDRRFYLNLGLLPTQVQAYQQLVPSHLLPEEVWNWLQLALLEGEISKGGFIYAGSVEAEQAASFQLQLDVDAAQMQFDSAWPSAEALKGWVRVDQGWVSGQVHEGRLLDADLQQVDFATLPGAKGQLLELRGDFSSDLNVFSELISNSPLQEWLPETLQLWGYQGQGQGKLNLHLPFYSSEDDLQLKVSLDIEEGVLDLSTLDMQLQAVTGDLTFDLSEGLSASQLVGRLWQQPFTAKITGPENLLSFTGDLDLADLLTWLDWPPLPWAEGVTQITGQLPLNPLASLELYSDLIGLTWALPEPFSKTETEPLALQFELALPDPELPLDLHLGEQLHLTLKLSEPEQGVGLALADRQQARAQLPGRSGLKVTADLYRLDVTQLLDWFQASYMTETVSPNPNSSGAAKEMSWINWLPEILVRSQEVVWGDYQQGLTAVRLEPEKDGLTASLISEPLIGELRIFSEAEQPWRLAMQRVRLPESKASEAILPSRPKLSREVRLASRTPDPWQTWRPGSWPDIDWTLERLERGAAFWGQWQGRLLTSPQRVTLQDVQGRLEASQLDATLAWHLLPESTTWLDWQLTGGDPAAALRSLLPGSRSPLVSEQHHFTGFLEWPGSPAGFFLADAQGELDIKFGRGYFPETEGTALGASRFFGLLNIDQLVRRLRLDFSDLTAEGISFDRLQGAYKLDQGYLYTRQPSLMQSSATRLKLSGEIDLLDETLNQELRVTLPVGQTLPLAAVVLGGPQLGLAIWLGQQTLGLFVDTRREAIYRVEGPINQPQLRLQKLR